MKKTLTIILLLTACLSATRAETQPADSALNIITLTHAEDTLTYYPATAFSGIPTLLYTDGIDSTMLQPAICFEDCQLAYRWIPATDGISLREAFQVQLMVYENGAEYEVHYAAADPMGCIVPTTLPAATKTIRNGQLFILRGEDEYTLLGNKH